MTTSESQVRDPIAIVGMDCRLPQADGIDEFWRLLEDGIDAISTVPSTRWDADSLWSADPADPGKTYCRWGGFVDDGDQFDATVFDIDSREAEFMDPQQGMALECAWRALEHAGIPPRSLRGSNTGTFVGISNCDFDRKLCSNLGNLEPLAGTGTSYSIVANRLSYALGLCGPSVAVDLACASSLVAVHLACQSLIARECDLALAGGVHLILSPEKTITFSRGRLLARDGRCKAFAEDADGYVRGEGCGMVALKRLSDAMQARDPIVAVILGSATNHNGASNGLSAPLGAAQENVLRAAYRCAHVDPRTIGYIEAHSPGTSLGDLIEVRSLAKVVTPGREPGNPCVIGSVKSNIGHLEGAAGIASLIKAALSVHMGFIPRTLHAARLNRSLPLASGVLEVATQARRWDEEPRRAGVSSFSFGGANGHVLLEAPPPASASPSQELDSEAVLVLSAWSATALDALVTRYSAYLSHAASLPSFADICYTAAVGRSHGPHRLAIVACSAEHARREIESSSNPKRRSSVLKGTAPLRAATTELHFDLADVRIENLGLPAALQSSADRLLDWYGSDLRADLAEEPDVLAGTARSLVVLSLLRLLGLTPAVVRVDISNTSNRAIDLLVNPNTLQRAWDGLSLRMNAGRHFRVLDLNADDGDVAALALSFRPADAPITLAQVLARAYVAGINPAWGAFLGDRQSVATMPKYPFERRRHWVRSVYRSEGSKLQGE